MATQRERTKLKTTELEIRSIKIAIEIVLVQSLFRFKQAQISVNIHSPPYLP